MEWYVYVDNINSRSVEPYNIFNHGGFANDCKQAYRQFKDDREQFIEAVRRSLMYYFWSKCEWELVLTGFPPLPNYPGAKIDVYDQVKLNWATFTSYIWTHRDDFKRSKTK